MKLLLGLVTVFTIILLVLMSSVYSDLYSKRDIENDELTIEEDFRIEKESHCIDTSDKKICFDDIIIHHNNQRYEIKNSVTGYVIHDKVIVKEEKIIDKDRINYGQEKPSPKDRIKDDQIRVYNQRVIIDISRVKWRYYNDSNSMDPLIDIGTNTIEIKPRKPDEIKIGDIISFNVEDNDYATVHRVIEIGKDDKGIYYITKGDNLKSNDNIKIRFKQIEGVIVGIFY